MNQGELVDELARRMEVDAREARRFIDTLHQIIGQVLADGGDVRLPGLGRFHTKLRRARIGHRPVTGEVVKIGARVVPVFAAGLD